MVNSRASKLINKSVDCMVSAIEIYNKPDFKYREEVFSVLAINSWELLLKAKILHDADNRIRSIYVKEKFKNKDGSKSKRWRYKESRSGNKITLDIFESLKRLQAKGLIDKICYENIELLTEIRDNSVHFYNNDALLTQKIQEIGTATLKSYLILVQDWFSLSLKRYNFYLMPLSFFHISKIEPIILGRRDNAANKLLAFIAEKEKQFPSNPKSEHNIAIAIATKVVKSSEPEAGRIRIATDEDAPEFKLKIEDVQRTHPLDYNELTTKLRIRYYDFKVNPNYHKIRRSLENKQKYCLLYPTNPKRPEGDTRRFYSPSIFAEFDKHYTKKGT